jgi:hypothetical protein
MTAYRIRCLAAIAVVALSLSISFGNGSRLLQELQNAGHALLFGVVSVLFLTDRKAGKGLYLRAFLLTLAFGIATELMQWVEGRDAELMDVVRDGLGAAAFLGVTWTIYYRTTPGKNFLIRLVSVCALLGVFCPSLLTAAALMHRWRRFPVIQDFDTTISTRFCSPGKIHLDFVSAPWNAEERAAQVTFEPALYSGFAIEGPWPNWAGHQDLTFTVYSALRQTVRLEIRIHDMHHNNEYSDRFNQELSIQPGLNAVEIPLIAVQSSLRGRQMDLGGIQAIGLFVVQSAKSFDLCFSRFQLE